jgi:hypothetical protein
MSVGSDAFEDELLFCILSRVFVHAVYAPLAMYCK